MKQFGKVILLTVVAVLVAASARYCLRRWFPSLYGDRKEAGLKAAAFTGTGTVPDPQGKPGPDRARQVDAKPAEELPYPTGHLWSRRGLNIVVMSDGSVLSMSENTEEKPRLERIQRYYVDYQGRRMYYRPNLVARGSGVKGTPVRQDGGQRLGDAPPAAVSATITAPLAGAGLRSSVAVTDAPIFPTPPSQSNSGSSSWEVGRDGVVHLTPSALAASIGR